MEPIQNPSTIPDFALMQSYQAQKEVAIAEVLKHFDFPRVHTAMTALNWHWAVPYKPETAVPTVARIQEKARELLSQVWDDNEPELETCVGGFRASKNDHSLALEFVLEFQYALVPVPGKKDICHKNDRGLKRSIF